MLLLVAKSEISLPDHPRVGTLVTPDNGATVSGLRPWAMDNSAFSGFDEDRFLRMVKRLSGTPGCLFLTVPDVVADHEATLDRWLYWSPRLRPYGFPLAFVGQDGCETVPPVADVLFIGGSTEWKLSAHAQRLIRGFDGWVHVGRVNSNRRLRLVKSYGADSVDGSGMAMFTETKLPGYLDASEFEQLSL